MLDPIMRTSILLISLFSASVTAAASPTITREQWGTKMTQFFTMIACEDGSFFRSCLALEADQCTNTAVSAARACLSDMAKEMPEVFINREQSKAWAGKVGECIGSALEMRHTRQRVNSEACLNPDVWQK